MLGLLFLTETLQPSIAYALTSGPSQPEVQGFAPAGSTDMVNLFTGDFSYNIPLLDVEGYPINLAYSAGVGMDQEASWVGLGWSLTPGAVERSLRGLPDDFMGDVMERDLSIRPNVTVGATAGTSFEIFGLGNNVNEDCDGDDTADPLSACLTLQVNPTYNNYDGIQFAIGANIGLESTRPGKSTYTAGLGVNSSSNGGLRVQPTMGIERGYWRTDDEQIKCGMNFGLSMDSRQGLSNISLGTSMRATRYDSKESENCGTKVIGRMKSPGPGTSFNFGQPTYTPQIAVPMRNTSISVRIAGGGAVGGLFPNGFIGGSYSKQSVKSKHNTSRAYGYLYLGQGQSDANGQLDMNREKDGQFTKSQTALPIASLTNDLFSVSGQNIAGSYRPYRDEVGHVFDRSVVSNGVGGSAGVEIGAGPGAHVGVDVKVNAMTTRSGDWSSNNSAGQRLRFRSGNGDALDEHVYFREANEAVVEQDDALYEGMGGDRPRRFGMSDDGSYDVRLTAQLEGADGSSAIPSTTEKTKRDPRGQLFTYLTHGEVERHLGLADPIARPNSPLSDPASINDHHISEVAVTATDGTRNVFGIPAYNLVQHDVTFATESGASEGAVLSGYTDAQNSIDNESGKDRFYSRSTTPGYAYAFLLTAALSADYSDIDGIRGPSPDDLGSYTKFSYELTDPEFSWRTPGSLVPNTARSDRGLGAVTHDDKASYVHGVKELWYLDKIESRNLVAVFQRSNRADGCGIGENGVLVPGDRQQQLNSIQLYERAAWQQYQDNGGEAPVPIKTVHFEYDYQLCPNTPNSMAGNKGKLTLTKVYFTYGASYRGRTSAYVFTYAGTNPDYDLGSSDRWGCFKPDDDTLRPNQSFPYAEQDPIAANANAAAWNLARIKLPSGGSIDVTYEADDYAYVQNRRAQRMFVINKLEPVKATGPDPAGGGIDHPQLQNTLPGYTGEYRVFFPLPSGWPSDRPVSDLFVGMGDRMYFRFGMRFDFGLINDQVDDQNDYVSGYARIGASGKDLSGENGWVLVHTEDMDENGGDQVMPMYRAALEKARRDYPNELYAPNYGDMDNGSVVQLVTAAASSLLTFFTGLAEYFQGPNRKAKANAGAHFGEVDKDRSWIRLTEPDGHKRGGGHRVRRIVFDDHWNDMVSGLTHRTYGQQYAYDLENGMSSGVAAWEPSIGADENVWREPFYHDVEATLGNDERFYQEYPFGESLFPGASVGYARVTVSDIYPDGYDPSAQGTGRVVNEFYTAKDFPTISKRTDLRAERRRSNFSVLSLLGLKVNDHMHATQGFVVETNDMHGKPKRTTVYAQASTGETAQELSHILYEYATDVGDPSHLDNRATTIAPDGTVGQKTIGRHYEFVADMREHSSKAKSGGMALNTEMIIPIILVPVLLFNFASESTVYRSGVLVKKIHRFGRLKRMEKMENGSVMSTENIAYDALTGGVLLTRTQNDFEDPVYAMRFPAYWNYDGMGPAYRNIGAVRDGLLFTDGRAAMAGADQVFVEGDELAAYATSGSVFKAWVDEVMPDGFHMINADGLPVSGTHRVKVIRSGRRNMQSVDMAGITLLSDPLQGFSSNVFTNILHAQALEMGDHWRTECACLKDGAVEYTANPFRLNQRGMWRVAKEHVWLTDRTRTITNNNTDIRRDGVYASYDPFYKVANGHWRKDPTGWTTTRTVTEYGPKGQEIESRDALGLLSSATFGYRGSLPKTVARNGGFTETGFDGFEEPYAPHCADRHFRIPLDPGQLVSTTAHTGRFSAKATALAPLVLTARLEDCDRSECGLRIIPHTSNETVSCYLVEGCGSPPTISMQVMDGTVAQGLTTDGFCLTGTAYTVVVSVTDGEGRALTQSLTR